MQQLLIRNLNAETVKLRSLQGELKYIVETAASTVAMEEMKQISSAWQEQLKAGLFTDSATELREDRNR